MSDQLGGEIILYSRADGTPSIEVRLDGDTVWLSQQQLADLFQTSRTNVVEHIANIYVECELSQEANLSGIPTGSRRRITSGYSTPF